jgi:hypothetical protein
MVSRGANHAPTGDKNEFVGAQFIAPIIHSALKRRNDGDKD